MRPLPLVLIAAALLLPFPACAEPANCPLYLAESTITIGKAPAGWSTMPASAVRLDDGGLLHGSPADEAILTPGTVRKVRGGTTDTKEFPAREEKWLWCEYGSGALKIAKRLPDAATVCTVTRRKVGPRLEIFAECR